MLTDMRGDGVIVRIELIHSVTRGTFTIEDAEWECTYIRMTRGTATGSGGDFFRVSETPQQIMDKLVAAHMYGRRDD